MRVERELMRGAGPVAVLKLLESRGEMYGYELVEALSRQSEGVLAMGQSTLYPLLYNLQAKGLVKAHWRTGTEADGGRDRKYYALTDRGRARRTLGLVDRVRPRFRTVVGVFPYIDRENYRRYLQFTERWENANAMDDAETVRFFARHGYRLDHREDATHLSQYRWNVRGARRFLNLLDPLFGGRPGNYWLAIFSREA